MIEELAIDLFVWAAVTVSLVKGEALDPIKEKIINWLPNRIDEFVGSLINCSQCAGFWIGILGALLYIPDCLNSWGTTVGIILHGFCVSLISTIIDRGIYGKNGNKMGPVQ